TRPAPDEAVADVIEVEAVAAPVATVAGAVPLPAAPEEDWAPAARPPLGENSLVDAKQRLGDAVEELVDVLRDPGVRHSIPDTDRANLAKYLTISKLKLENVIAMVRSDDPGT